VCSSIRANAREYQKMLPSDNMTWQKNASIKCANIVGVRKGRTGTDMRLIDAADTAQGPQLTASTSRKRHCFTEAFKVLCNIRLFFNREDLSAPIAQSQVWRITPCRLFVITYLTHSQPPIMSASRLLYPQSMDEP